jgi:hypothetical protein
MVSSHFPSLQFSFALLRGPHNYILELRDLYNRHFFPNDPPAVLPKRVLTEYERSFIFEEDENEVDVEKTDVEVDKK